MKTVLTVIQRVLAIAFLFVLGVGINLYLPETETRVVEKEVSLTSKKNLDITFKSDETYQDITEVTFNFKLSTDAYPWNETPLRNYDLIISVPKFIETTALIILQENAGYIEENITDVASLQKYIRSMLETELEYFGVFEVYDINIEYSPSVRKDLVEDVQPIDSVLEKVETIVNKIDTVVVRDTIRISTPINVDTLSHS